MDILLFGVGGFIGREIALEARRRGHHVTAAVRDPARHAGTPAADAVVAGDATDADAVARLAAGRDAVLSAIGPGSRGDPAVIPAAARALVLGLPRVGVRRLLVVGGAGTLELSPGVQRLDAPGYPEEYRPQGIAQREALAVLRASALDWTCVSPPIVIAAGASRGVYRVGGDAVLRDAEGRSAISAADYALAFIDELERPRAPGRRITVAY
ncbi:MAG: NAD(P)H-binding protein [Rhodobacteraceae bacterium]|nr:NAD(P)H-binding protein [Paracoccaceae bacterium]